MRVLIMVVMLALAATNLQAQDPQALQQQIQQIQQQLDALKGQQQGGGSGGGNSGGSVSLRPMETGRSRDLKRNERATQGGAQQGGWATGGAQQRGVAGGGGSMGGQGRPVQQYYEQQPAQQYRQPPQQRQQQQQPVYGDPYYGGGAAPNYNTPNYSNTPNYNTGYNTGYASIYNDNWNNPQRGGYYGGGGLYNRVAIKTNAAYWALATVNLGVEFALGGKSTLELSGGVNRWGKAPKDLTMNAMGGAQDALGMAYKARQTDHVLGKAELKFWFVDRFDGHFLGVHAFYADYDIYGVRFPLLFEKDLRYDGTGLGVGLTYGYHWRWSPRWGMDMSFGAGMVSFNYDKRPWASNSTDAEVAVGDFKKTYFGPTAVGLKLFFMIK